MHARLLLELVKTAAAEGVDAYGLAETVARGAEADLKDRLVGAVEAAVADGADVGGVVDILKNFEV